MIVTPFSVRRRGRSFESSSTATTSDNEFFDTSCSFSYPIFEFIEGNVDSKVSMPPSRMDALLIAPMPRIANDSKSATGKGMDSLSTEQASSRRP